MGRVTGAGGLERGWAGAGLGWWGGGREFCDWTLILNSDSLDRKFSAGFLFDFDFGIDGPGWAGLGWAGWVGLAGWGGLEWLAGAGRWGLGLLLTV